MQTQVDTEKQAKLLDCPLCEKKGIIPFEKELHNYYSHAKECEALVEIDDPYRGPLLKSKIMGENHKELFGEILTASEYDDILNQDGFQLELKGYPKKHELVSKAQFWSHVLFIRHCKHSPMSGVNHSHYPQFESKDPNKAFAMIQHFLFCGEAIKIYAYNNGPVQRIWRWDRNLRRLVYKGEKPFANTSMFKIL